MTARSSSSVGAASAARAALPPIAAEAAPTKAHPTAEVGAVHVHIRRIVWHGEGALPAPLLQAQIAQALASRTGVPPSTGAAIAQAISPYLRPAGGPQ